MSDIIGFEKCREALERLLAQVAAAIETARRQGPDALQATIDSETDRLVDFAGRAEPIDDRDAADVEEIRQLVRDVVNGIINAAENEIIGQVEECAKELSELAKKVDRRTKDNEREARNLHLKPVREAIDAATNMVEALKDAKDGLTDGDDDDVKAKIERIIAAIAEAKQAVQSA